MSWLHSPLLLIINALAAYRVERLISRDSFPPVAWLRDTVLDRLNGDRLREHWLSDLVGCPWCLGFWVAVGVVVLQSTIGWLWIWVAVPLSFSAVIGHLARREE